MVVVLHDFPHKHHTSPDSLLITILMVFIGYVVDILVPVGFPRVQCVQLLNMVRFHQLVALRCQEQGWDWLRENLLAQVLLHVVL